jgi:hypothetical protein
MRSQAEENGHAIDASIEEGWSAPFAHRHIETPRVNGWVEENTQISPPSSGTNSGKFS